MPTPIYRILDGGCPGKPENEACTVEWQHSLLVR